MKKIVLPFIFIGLIMLAPSVFAQNRQSQDFVIDGKISNASDNSFIIMGDVIGVPNRLADKLKGTGIISSGREVKVVGEIENGIEIARKIVAVD